MDIRSFLESIIDPTNGERLMDAIDLYEEFIQVFHIEPRWEWFNVKICGIAPGGWCLRGPIGETVLLQQCEVIRALGEEYTEAADRWYAVRHDSVIFFIDNLEEAVQGCNDEEKVKRFLIGNVAHERRHSYQSLELFSKGGMATTMKDYDTLPHEADANNFMRACVKDFSLLLQAETYPVDTTCHWTHHDEV